MPMIDPAIENYAAQHSEKPGALLERLREETFASMESPRMQVGQLEGDFLRLLVRLSRAQRILEIGMFTGYSALMMAEGLPEDGELYTCEVNPKAEEMARRYFAQSPHGKKIQIRMGPALETIRTLQGPLDLVFIDADKENYGAYYDAVLPLVRQGGLIVADNTLWSGRVLAPQEESDRAIVAFNTMVANDPRVEKVLVTVRDGMMLAWKR
ncbi:MAG: class I SAM-dependent methyltransferase [Myxococcota bacterium]|nr:class I SAM-dependent methyltransferase [Myxococcota bacterium]